MIREANVDQRSPIRLRQPWLNVARAVWIILAVTNLLLAVTTLPRYYSQLANPASEFLGLGWTDALFNQALAALHLTIAGYTGFIVAFDLIRVLVFTSVAGLIFWHKSDEWLGLFASYVLMGIGWAIGGRLEWYYELPLIWRQVVSIPIFIIWPAFFIFLNLYPDGRYIPSWTRYLTLIWLTFGILISVAYDSSSTSTPWWFTVVGLILLGIGFAAQVYRYLRISGPVERLQMRWFLFSIVCLFGIQAVNQYFVKPIFHQPGSSQLLYLLVNHALYDTLFTLVPISIGIALFRYHLWDIDLIIRRTLIYSTLTAVLALVYFGGVALMQRGFVALTGQESPLAVVASTLAIAALFTPVRRRVQNVVDRRFFRRKYDAEKTVDAFARAARDEVDMDRLRGELMRVVEETMQPECVSLWLVAAPKVRSSLDS